MTPTPEQVEAATAQVKAVVMTDFYHTREESIANLAAFLASRDLKHERVVAELREELDSICPDGGRQLPHEELIAAHRTWAMAKEVACRLSLTRAEQAEALVGELRKEITDWSRGETK